MEQNKRNKTKIVITVLAVLLVLSLIALAGTLIYNRLSVNTDATVTVLDNIITPETDEDNSDTSDTSESESNGGNGGTSSAVTSDNTNDVKAGAISLYKKHLQDNTLFSIENMFPGDSETKYYRVRVSYHDKITVHFNAQTREGQESASEVMGVKVKLVTSGETLYEGLMQDMPQSLTYTMTSAESTTAEIYYEITAYLDTSAGNEYQNKEILLDFLWWADETGNLDDPPQTGDTSSIVIWSVTATVSALVLLLLLIFRRKKEDEQNER